MKPDWKDAPEWANWIAQDRNGSWWWFQFKPRWDGGVYVTSKPGSGFKLAKAAPRRQKGMLEPRP